MNLADSVKYIFKNKSSHFVKELWKEDLKTIATDVTNDVTYFMRKAPSSLKSFKNKKPRINAREFFESSADMLLILKVFPGRIKRGFGFFKDDFLDELEKFPDQKQKTIFVLKVFGAISSFSLGAFYNLKIGKTDFALVGLRRRNAFTRFLVAELIFKISRRMMQRFLNELEILVTEKDDLNHVRYFKELLADRTKALEVIKEAPLEQGDRAIEIVESLKTYIMKGHWNSSQLSHDRKSH